MPTILHLNAVNAQFNHDIGQLYVNNYRWLVNKLYKKLSCPQKAADLAQDTFTRILTSRNNLHLFEEKAILSTISKGLLVDYYRRQAIETAYLNALAHLPETQIPSPEDSAIIVETLCEIDQMLEALPSKARQIFLLSQLDGLTYPQIATKLNISLSSVQKHMTQTYLACYAVRFQSQ
jgi:RNA polymerase sigma factor (sigma-70 family)